MSKKRSRSRRPASPTAHRAPDPRPEGMPAPTQPAPNGNTRQATARRAHALDAARRPLTARFRAMGARVLAVAREVAQVRAAERAEAAAAPARETRRRVNLPLALTLSVAGHVAFLALSSRVNLESAQASRIRYSRVRLVNYRPDEAAEAQMRVRLPGARVQDAPAQAALPGQPAPDAEAIRRQMERIAALRADFFRPMNVVNVPMPVFARSPSGDLPPLWGLPLPNGVNPLPTPPVAPPAVDPDKQRLADLMRQGPAKVDTPNEMPSESAAQDVMDLLKHPGPLVAQAPGQPEETPSTPDEGAANADSGAQSDTPGSAGPATPEAPGASSSAPEGPASAGKPSETPDTPAAGSGSAAEAPPEEGASAQTSAPAEEPAPGAEGEAEATPTPGAGEAPVAVHIPDRGAFSDFSGKYRIPSALALPGYQGAGSVAALAREVSERTQVKLTMGGEAPLGVSAAEDPILYLRCGGKVALSDEQGVALKAYVEGGGTLLVDGATGEFGDSIRAELERVFDEPTVLLSPRHPIYSAYYRLPEATGARTYPLRAILLGDRPAVILSATFLGRRWAEKTDPEHEVAVAHGVNIVVYALAHR